MKVLIVYSSKNGVAKKCAEILNDKLANSFEISLVSAEESLPSPECFDVVIIGGSIRFSRLEKNLKSYIRTNAETLSNMNTAVFICCGRAGSFDEYAKEQLPKGFCASLGVHYFGGELKPDKLHGLDKLLVMIMRSEIKSSDPDDPNNSKKMLPEILPDNISLLADSVRKLL